MPIYDQTFRHYEGPRNTHLAWWAVAVQTLRPMLKNKFVWLVGAGNLIPVIFISVAFFGLSQVDQLGFKHDLSQMLKQSRLPLDTKMENFPTLLWIFLRWVFPAAWLLALVGAGCISMDKKNNALPLYFSRPLRLSDYIWGKIVGLAILPFSVAAASLLIIYVQAAAYFFEPARAAAHLVTLLSALLCVFLSCLLVAVAMAAISAVTPNPRVAGISYFGFWLGTQAIVQPLARMTGKEILWAFVPMRSLEKVWEILLGANSDMIPRHMRMGVVPPWAATVGIVGWLVLFFWILRRNLRIVEVVK